MQAQYHHHHPPPFQLPHHDLYHTIPQPPYQHSQGDPNDYFSTAGLDLSSFFRGSSLPYPHQDYEHIVYRGRAPATRLVEPLVSLTGATTISSCATGIGITGNHQQQQQFLDRAVFQPQPPPPEDIPDFSQEQHWEWDPLSERLHGAPVAPVLPAPVPAHCDPPIHLSQQQQPEFFVDKSSSGGYVNETPQPPPVVLSPAAQLPTPASMAILLNPNSRFTDKRNEPTVYQPLPIAGGRDAQGEVPPPPVVQPSVEGDNRPAQQETPPSISAEITAREKKHACTMCHKRFDRPSTLRKHLLVHTGEKSFVCDTCGRRFGVASNRNRHLKACVRKSTNAAQAGGSQSSTGGTPDASVGLSPPTGGSSSTTSASASTSSSNSGRTRSAESPVETFEAARKVKRRRRAPSPSNWIPASLLSFNLSPPESKKATPVPLPPVRRNLPLEERDSWDENVSLAPYHPQGWKDVLPGPALGTGLGWKDLRNLKLEKNGEQVLGRVLVF